MKKQIITTTCILAILFFVILLGINVQATIDWETNNEFTITSTDPDLETGIEVPAGKKLIVGNPPRSFIGGADGGEVKAIESNGEKYFQAKNVIIVDTQSVHVESAGPKTNIIFNSEITPPTGENFIKITQGYEETRTRTIQTNTGSFKIQADTTEPPKFVLDEEGKLTTGTKFTNQDGYTLEYLENNQFKVTHTISGKERTIDISIPNDANPVYQGKEEGKPARLQVGEDFIPIEDIPEQVKRYSIEDEGVLAVFNEEGTQRSLLQEGTYLSTNEKGEMVVQGTELKDETGALTNPTINPAAEGEQAYRFSKTKAEVWSEDTDLEGNAGNIAIGNVRLFAHPDGPSNDGLNYASINNLEDKVFQIMGAGTVVSGKNSLGFYFDNYYEGSYGGILDLTGKYTPSQDSDVPLLKFYTNEQEKPVIQAQSKGQGLVHFTLGQDTGFIRANRQSVSYHAKNGEEYYQYGVDKLGAFRDGQRETGYVENARRDTEYTRTQHTQKGEQEVDSSLDTEGVDASIPNEVADVVKRNREDRAGGAGAAAGSTGEGIDLGVELDPEDDSDKEAEFGPEGDTSTTTTGDIKNIIPIWNTNPLMRRCSPGGCTTTTTGCSPGGCN